MDFVLFLFFNAFSRILAPFEFSGIKNKSPQLTNMHLSLLRIHQEETEVMIILIIIISYNKITVHTVLRQNVIQ